MADGKCPSCGLYSYSICRNKVNDDYRCNHPDCGEDRYFDADGKFTGGTYNKYVIGGITKKSDTEINWIDMDKHWDKHWDKIASYVLPSTPNGKNWAYEEWGKCPKREGSKHIQPLTATSIILTCKNEEYQQMLQPMVDKLWVQVGPIFEQMYKDFILYGNTCVDMNEIAERMQSDDGRQHNQKKGSTMNLYNIAAVRVEHKNADGEKVPAKVAVGPDTILAPNSEVAKAICIRKLSEEDAADLTLIDVLVRAF